MKIIEPSYEILDRRELTPVQKIAYAARLAYKSENKIEEDIDGMKIVRKMFTSGHYPTLEFSNHHFLIKMKYDESRRDDHGYMQSVADYFYSNFDEFITSLFHYKRYVSISIVEKDNLFGILVSGTFRALGESIIKTNVCGSDNTKYPIFSAMILSNIADNKNIPFNVNELECTGFIMEDETMKSMYECIEILPEEVMTILDEKDYEDHIMCAVKFIVNRAVTHELVRHRPCSFIQESQRYCRYSNEKFGREVTFIMPSAFWSGQLDITDEDDPLNIWLDAMQETEKAYMKLLDLGNSPQAARTVLPNSCKTEIIVFTTITEWKHIFKLRTSPEAEPSMRQVMVPLSEEFFSDENKQRWE